MMISGRFQRRADNPFDDSGFQVLPLASDYRVPQPLYASGSTDYSRELTTILRQRRLIEPGSQLELEVTCATIVAGEAIKEASRTHFSGNVSDNRRLDYPLWRAATDYKKGTVNPKLIVREMLPHHQVITTDY